MKKFYKSIILILLSLFTIYTSAYADETNCNNTTVEIVSKINSECAADGKIVARLVGPDTAYVNMNTVQFRVVAQTSGGRDTHFSINNGVISNLPPATYIVQTRAFCYQQQDSIQVTKNSQVITIGGTYQQPNMYVETENIRKTLNCMVSGMIPLGFFGGKAPYTAVLDSFPAEYTGTKTFTYANEGHYEINNVPAGRYVFTLTDACGYNWSDIKAVVGTVTSDFPVLADSVYCSAIRQCDLLDFYYSFNVSESHELYQYFKNFSKYYEPVLYMDDNTDTVNVASYIGSISGAGTSPNHYYNQQRVQVKLIDHTYGDVYRPSVGGWPRGDHRAYAAYRIKGTNCVSTKNSLIIVKTPYLADRRMRNLFCDGINVFARQWTDSDGVICYPIKGELYDAQTDTLIDANNNITSSVETCIGRVPYGSTYYYKFTSLAGGASWTSSRTNVATVFTAPNASVKKSIYASYTAYSTCGDVYGKKGHIYFRNSSSTYYTFIPGTVIKLVEAPSEQVFPHDSIVVRDSTVTFIYPYSSNPFASSTEENVTSYISDMMHGIHKFEIIDPCDGQRDTFVIDYPDRKAVLSNFIHKLDYCPENGRGGYILLYNSQGVRTNTYNSTHGYYTRYFTNGTVIKVKSAPLGQVIPHDSILITTANITQIFPYASSPTTLAYSDIKPGTHVFELISPCGDTSELSINWSSNTPVYYNEYDDRYYGTGHYNNTKHCKDNIGKFYSYLYSNNPTIPGGTRIKLKSGPPGYDPATVIHSDVIIPGGTTKNFAPFNIDYTDAAAYIDLGNIMSGTYVFEIQDEACGKTVEALLIVPEVFTIGTPLSATVDYTCTSANVYPQGQVKFGPKNFRTYFKIRSAWNEDGTVMSTNLYDNNQISSGMSFNLNKNGRYLIQMHVHTGSANSYCFTDTISFWYKQPTPRLDMSKTSAYVCAGDNVGYLKLQAVGGHGNGPYEYRILGTDSVNYTGEFRYGAPGEELEIVITDMSPEAQAINCAPQFTQRITMVDLKDSGIAYTTADRGIFCEGTTIDLNMISLGETKYDWTGPNGFTADSVQYPRIPNANLSMTGWYKVTVEPEHCGVPFVDSVFIDVRLNPVAVNLGVDTIGLCRRSTGNYFLTLLNNPQPSAGCTLKWYDTNGNEMTVNSSTQINSNTIGFQTYWVSQINDDSGCEGPKTPFVVEVRALPVAPNVLYPTPVCWGDSVTFRIADTKANYTYHLHLSNTAASIKDVPGNGDTLTIKYNPIYTQTNYWFSLTDEIGCTSTRAQRTVEMADFGELTDVTLRHDTICSGEQGVITVSSLTLSNPVYRWYNGTSATATLLGTGDSFTSSVYTYTSNGMTYYNVAYLSIEADGLCETPPANRYAARVYVKGYVTPSVSQTTKYVCHGDSVLIRPYLSSGVAYADSVFYWYTSQNETTPFHIGDSLWITPPTNSSVTYYIACTSAQRCLNPTGGNRRAVTIYDRNFELRYAGNATSACMGSGIQLNAYLNNSSGYNSSGSWTSSDTNIATIATNGYITPVAPGKVVFRYHYSSSSLNCEVESDTLTIYAAPSFTFEGGRDSICVGDTITISASEAGTWTSFNTSIAQVLNNNADIKGVAAGNTYFRFTSSVTGCVNNTEKLYVIAYPTVTPITGDNFVCVGSTVELRNATSGGVWSSSDVAKAAIYDPSTIPALVLAKVEGNVEIYYTVGSLCKTIVKHPLTVLPVAPPDIIIGIDR